MVVSLHGRLLLRFFLLGYLCLILQPAMLLPCQICDLLIFMSFGLSPFFLFLGGFGFLNSV